MSHEKTIAELPLIDYGAAGEFGENNYPFIKPVLAQGAGRHFVAIYKLDKPLKRVDGKLARYELEYRNTSNPCQNIKDDAWSSAEFTEHTYWLRKELKPILDAIAQNKRVNAFEHLNIW
ncbi:MAG: hypothetical protein RBQ99_01720 [Trichlorobacter sp.]|nr:hypothetical protein [Trichlorobacter sp.]